MRTHSGVYADAENGKPGPNLPESAARGGGSELSSSKAYTHISTGLAA